MNADEIDRILSTTLEDRRLSRSERQALRQVVAEQGLDAEKRAFWRHRVFAIARQAMSGAAVSPAEARDVLEWVEDVIKALEAPTTETREHEAAVHFSPGNDCLDCIVRLLRQSQRSVDICVFTITDDRLADPILDVHQRGVTVRIITDDEKSLDRGSDVFRLQHAGIPVRVDRSEHHMHHKFAVFDNYTVVTGSYNWTRSAANFNRENLLLSSDPRVVAPFRDSFEQLWTAFSF